MATLVNCTHSKVAKENLNVTQIYHSIFHLFTDFLGFTFTKNVYEYYKNKYWLIELNEKFHFLQLEWKLSFQLQKARIFIPGVCTARSSLKRCRSFNMI